MNRKPFAMRRLLLSATLLLPLLAHAAEAYPSRPIRMIVPFGAGGTSDVVARLIAARLTESLKQTVNVEPKPGANGIIGTDTVAKAAPDGYTLLLTVASAQTLTPALYKLPFDPVKDFAPVSLVANLGGIFLVNANLPVRTMQEFATEARKRPGRFSYGAGTSLLRLIGASCSRMPVRQCRTSVPAACARWRFQPQSRPHWCPTCQPSHRRCPAMKRWR